MSHLSFTQAVTSGVLLLWAAHAHAYLDPATGSIILQGLLAGFAGLMVVLRLHWTRVKAFFHRLRRKPAPAPAMDGSGGSRPSTSDPS